ncbi:hypothetical protein CY0110_19472 [Crocosphaera chwakensis CCY0110]|uniref:Uncharacterized protein n=1 Tax=Crocosphaera chwakensis CCY0110 TaxID=391612 RepID=A3IJM6_9CHRO|nr:hypothetical protein CY0110_19472 [Crocosphaera chwakensis CCY0110]
MRERIQASLGLRASNNSSILGKPWIMSPVFARSYTSNTKLSPRCTRSPSAICKMAPGETR